MNFNYDLNIRDVSKSYQYFQSIFSNFFQFCFLQYWLDCPTENSKYKAISNIYGVITIGQVTPLTHLFVDEEVKLFFFKI